MRGHLYHTMPQSCNATAMQCHITYAPQRVLHSPLCTCPPSPQLDNQRCVILYAYLMHNGLAVTCEYQWAVHAGMFSPSYAGGHSTSYSLSDAKAKCIELGPEVCKAITCSSSGRCALGASANLGHSPNGQTSHTPNAACYSPGEHFYTHTKSP